MMPKIVEPKTVERAFLFPHVETALSAHFSGSLGLMACMADHGAGQAAPSSTPALLVAFWIEAAILASWKDIVMRFCVSDHFGTMTKFSDGSISVVIHR